MTQGSFSLSKSNLRADHSRFIPLNYPMIDPRLHLFYLTLHLLEPLVLFFHILRFSYPVISVQGCAA